jgi:hypothetical protein
MRRSFFQSTEYLLRLGRNMLRPRCSVCARVMIALVLAAAVSGLAQTADSPTAGLPQDSGGVFAAVAPNYDYSGLKPWHLKATYQLYDDAGKPTEQGTYEYWRASKQVYRSSWTRGSVTYTEWHTADGKVARQGGSEALNYFEYKLETALISPLTAAGRLDPAKFRLDENAVTEPHSVVSCYSAAPIEAKDVPPPAKTFWLFPTYCFNTKLHLLLGIDDFGTQTMKFYDFKQIEGKYLARVVDIRDGDRDVFSAQVESIGEISPSDPALTPPEGAKPVRIETVQVDPGAAERLLVKKVAPVYPENAKNAHVQGAVVFQAIIGIDGRVRDLQLVSAPAVSEDRVALWTRNRLVSSAFSSISQWRYKPYVHDDEPVEVETTVAVTYSIGG